MSSLDVTSVPVPKTVFGIVLGTGGLKITHILILKLRNAEHQILYKRIAVQIESELEAFSFKWLMLQYLKIYQLDSSGLFAL